MTALKVVRLLKWRAALNLAPTEHKHSYLHCAVGAYTRNLLIYATALRGGKTYSFAKLLTYLKAPEHMAINLLAHLHCLDVSKLLRCLQAVATPVFEPGKAQGRYSQQRPRLAEKL
eukprot:21125-Heterococcus_DN1.PRE.1